nr:EAL domain-containing protein [Azospirillum sp. SYSU D00513]
MLHSGPAEGAALRALIGKEVPGERAYFDLARPATDVLRVPAALDSRGLILAYRRLAKFPLVANVSFTEAEVFAAAEERALFLRRSALAASAGILLCAFGLFLLRNGQHRTRIALIRANGLLRGNERVLEERVRDRTRALELSNQQVRELAYSDGVTGLPNRALLADRAEQAVQAARRYGRKLAFLFLDLDHFKTVNDTLGHQAGDQLLAAVALRLRAAVRMSDSVARMGGDEFVVMVEELEDSRDAAHTADRIMAALRTPFSLEGRELHVGVSIGIAMFPDDGADMPALLKNADTAMYAAKTAGRNALRFFSPAMTEAAERRLELESALRRAVAQADFTLVYQPKIYAATGQLCGVEALLRWHHPERGWVPPSEFIPLAEEIGLIEPLGAWVINEACRFIAGWDGQSLGALRVAVNVAAGQINRGDLGAVVERALKLHGIDPALLEIEVTESAVIADTARATATLNRLRALGVTVALDDFGTGYSSLVYLRRIDIDSIKIDRSFLTDVRPGSRDADLVRQIIRLAQSLRLSVVAEGVETAEHRSFLEEAGCDMLQGYHIARPMPAADLRDWLARRQDGRKAGEPLSRQPSQLARA